MATFSFYRHNWKSGYCKLKSYTQVSFVALTNVIGRCKRHDVIDAVPLYEQTLWVNYLFAGKCVRLYRF